MVRAVLTNIQRAKGFYLLPSLAAISLIVLILSPRNGYAWGLFALFVFRIYRMQIRELLLCTCAILIVTGMVTLSHTLTNQSHLSSEIKTGILEIDPTTYRVNGNGLSGEAELLGEKIVFFHQIKNEVEKNEWLNLTTPIYMQATFTLEEPETATNRFQFDYRTYLKRKKIHWKVNIQEVAAVTPNHSLGSIFSVIRLRFFDYLNRMLPNAKSKDYIMAMLFNQTDDIDTLAMAAYRKIGILHIFSISGMHIYFLVTTLQYGLLRMRVSRETTYPILLVTILLYAFLIGSGVGIFRAVFTHSFSLVAKMSKREISAKDAFAFAILLALWQNPYLVFSIAFQLSYSLSGLLYFLSPSLEKMRIPSLAKSFLLSLIMTCISGIFLSYHYFEIIWLGMFVNIIFSFFFSYLLFPLFWLLTLLAALKFPVAILSPLSMSMTIVIEKLEVVSQQLADTNWLLMITGRQPLLWYLGLAACLLAFLVAFEQRKHLFLWMMLVTLSFFFFYSLPKLNPNGRVIMLDVGQGDALLIKTPFNRDTVLIDTGGVITFNEEEDWKLRKETDYHAKNLVSAIKAEGVGQLDAVFLTHSDTDHIGNLDYLANELPIRHMYIASGMEETATFLAEVSGMHHIPPITSLMGPSQVELNTLAFQVLNPNHKRRGENNDSLVLYSKIGGLSWLFTGDLEESGEQDLMRRYPNLQADILKVGHHGSNTSTSSPFLKRVNPRGAFISVGRKNRYGHPTPEVVERLEAQKITIYRTDLNGAVHFIYNQRQKRMEIMLQ